MSTDGKLSLETVDEVVAALGGDEEAKKLAGVATPHAVSMWRNRGNFPPNTYVAFTAILESRGLSAPASLWRMRERAS